MPEIDPFGEKPKGPQYSHQSEISFPNAEIGSVPKLGIEPLPVPDVPDLDPEIEECLRFIDSLNRSARVPFAVSVGQATIAGKVNIESPLENSSVDVVVMIGPVPIGKARLDRNNVAVDLYGALGPIPVMVSVNLHIPSRVVGGRFCTPKIGGWDCHGDNLGWRPLFRF